MLKRMDKLGLVEHEPYKGVRLSETGERMAIEVIRHHRLIEAYLAEALGMPWDRVHDEAEVLEHYISEELEERMSAALGHPDRDPHGDPIPDRELSFAVAEDALPLSALEPGAAGVFARVSDGDPEMLRYLSERSILPGAELEVTGPPAVRRPARDRGRRHRARDRRRPRRAHVHRRFRRCAGRAAPHVKAELEEELDDRRVPIEAVLPGEAAVAEAARRSIEDEPGRRRGLRALWPFLGPAFVAAVAYIDPGNFATNIAGGAQFGYLLLWVVLAANLMAMLIQTQSAKLGIATGRNLPELCRALFSRRTSRGLWVQAELVAMATDVAEVVGAALGLNLLFGIPLFEAGLIAGAGAFAILALQQRGVRRLEAVIAGLVGVVVVAFGFEVTQANPDAEAASSTASSSPASTASTASCWRPASSARR